MAYRTVDSRLFVGNNDLGIDLSGATTEWTLQGNLTVRSHTALGIEPLDAIPTAAGHTLNAGIFVDPDFPFPGPSVVNVALVFPPAKLAAVGPMVLRARPISFPRDDLALVQAQFQPANLLRRCIQVLPLKATTGNVRLDTGDEVWVAAEASAAATVVVGGTSTAIPKGGSVRAVGRPSNGSAVAITTTGNPTGYVMVGMPVTLGTA